jgi:hypothetical protein
MLYEAGREAKRWEHAEEFIERLEYGAMFPPLGRALWVELRALLDELQRYDKANQHDLSYNHQEAIFEMRDDSRRLLAAEIADFTMGAHPKFEKWTPYVTWANTLASTDAVITFNYDKVPDLLAESGAALQIPSRVVGSLEPGKAVVVKLHGSVNWRVQNDSSIRVSNHHPLDTSVPGDVAIATPGPQKKEHVVDEGIFSTLRAHAEAAIGGADAIVIVGYSLPPTDAETKDWLIRQLSNRADRLLDERSERHAKWTQSNAQRKSIAQRAGGGHRAPPVVPFVEEVIPVHLVLGPDRTTGHAERLIGLIKSVSPCFTVANWIVRAEDFLGLCKRGQLLKKPARIKGFVEVDD